MDNRYRLWTTSLIALTLSAASGAAWAEEAAALALGAPAAAAPAAPRAPAAAASQELPSTTVPTPEEPAVAAILATNPSTPPEWARAAKLLADLGRPDLAKAFLKKVLDANLAPDQLAALEERFGALMFTQMSGRAELAPEAQQLNEAVLAAVTERLQDPARLAALLQQLQNPSPETRAQAAAELRRARSAAVAPLMAVLADPARAAEHPGVRAVLVGLKSEAADPLIALLDSGDAKLATVAAGVLGELKSEKAAPYLAAMFASRESDPAVRRAAEQALLKLTGRTPSEQEAASLAARHARAYFDQEHRLDTDAAGNVTLWTWDPAAKELRQDRYSADDASLVLACRLAREAHTVAPDDPAIRTLYLATVLERAAYQNGLDKPLDEAAGTPAGRAAEFGSAVIEQVLRFAMETGHAPAAAAAARILGRIGSAEALLYQGAGPSPLVQALSAPDRRVRFAALEAVVWLDPAQPFPGSSRVVDALAYFAASEAKARALVAGPSTAESQRLGGYLVALGYELDTAITGREAIEKLLASPDYELAFLDAQLQRPTVDFLLQQLRHDCRTAELPVGVTARAGLLERARHLVRNDPLAEAFSRPHTQEAVLWQVEELKKRVGREAVQPAERQRQAALAMKWLADLTGREETIYNLDRAEDVALDALAVPALAPDAVVVLGNLGTPRSQQALVDLASRWTQPLALRGAAARAFRQSTERRGLLLTTPQILQQYDRYNQSASQDPGTQQVLGLILDIIEAPTGADAAEVRAEGQQVAPGAQGPGASAAKAQDAESG